MRRRRSGEGESPRVGLSENPPASLRSATSPRRRGEVTELAALGYFAAAGNAGSLFTSRASCWMMTVALKFAAIFLKRSIDASDSARFVLNVGTPLLS